jgi:hypothetical protein
VSSRRNCRTGRSPPPRRTKSVAALATRWKFVTSPLSQPYVDRIARLVGARIERAPKTLRVVFVDLPEHRALALPSGTLMLSTGLLTSLRDEAELAFVLGHEISHAASGEVAVRLVRLGFKATARERGDSDGCAGVTRPSISSVWDTAGDVSGTPTRVRSTRSSPWTTTRNPRSST